MKTSLVNAIKKYIEDFYGDNPEKSKDYCRIISEKHFDRLSALLEKGNIVAVGKTNRSQLYIVSHKKGILNKSPMVDYNKIISHIKLIISELNSKIILNSKTKVV